MTRLVCVVAIAVVYLANFAIADDNEEVTYSNKYDHVDVDAILANDRLRTQYYKCFLGTGPCLTPDAIFFHERFPEAIVTKCRKCTARQKDAFEKIATWFNDNDPKAWEAVIRKAVEDFTKKGVLMRAAKTAQTK